MYIIYTKIPTVVISVVIQYHLKVLLFLMNLKLPRMVATITEKLIPPMNMKMMTTINT